MRIFLDSSALAKKYIQEKGSEKIQSLLADPLKHSIYVSVICLPEIFSALNRIKREQFIQPHQYSQIKENILNDFKQFSICNLTPIIFSKTIVLLEQHSLRTIDAIHLACALEIKPDIFVSADLKQITAAKKSKIKILRV